MSEIGFGVVRKKKSVVDRAQGRILRINCWISERTIEEMTFFMVFVLIIMMTIMTDYILDLKAEVRGLKNESNTTISNP